jgi:hypothetical protein
LVYRSAWFGWVSSFLVSSAPLQRGLVKAEKWAAILAGNCDEREPSGAGPEAGGSLGGATMLDGTDGER